MRSTSSAVASSAPVRQLAMSPAATTSSAEGTGSVVQPHAVRRTATVIPVAILLLAPPLLIRCPSPPVDKVPEGSMNGYDPDYAPGPGDSYQPLIESTLGTLLEPFSESFGRCLPTRARQEVPKLLRKELPQSL